MLRAPLLALTLVLLAAAGASAASMTIAPSDGGAERSLTLADLASRFDVHGVAYTVRSADGTESTTTVADGISLNALLTAAGLDEDVFDYIALQKADGSIAIVMRDDLGGTEEGPPVVWADAQGTHFLRPSNGDGDQNGADLVTLGDGAPLTIALRRGQPLVPRIAVSTLRVRPGERVDFAASLVGGASPGPGLDYWWYFDGTGTVQGANVSHRFPPGGPYLVVLRVVRGDGTAIGDPDTVTVRVARPRERRPDEARGSVEATGGGAGNGAGGGTGDAGEGGGSGAGTPASAPAVAGPAPAASVPERVPAARRAPPGELVSGTLIASTSAAATPAGARPAASAAARGAASDGPLDVPVGVWIAAGLALILALGWALESRNPLPFWQP